MQDMEIRTFRKPRQKYERTRDQTLSSLLLKKSEYVGQCLVWRGSINLRGYGEFGYHGYSTTVHVLAYKEWKGEIPKGMTVDHLCRNKLCINPNHLHITSKVNNRIIASRNKIICLKGHDIKYPNTSMCYFKKGKLICKQCQNDAKMIHGYYYV